MFGKNKNSDTKSSLSNRSKTLTVAMSVLARPGAFLRRAWNKYSRSPRVFKMAAVYLLTILTMVGLFIWHASSLRLQFPYSSMEEAPPDRFRHLWEEEGQPWREEMQLDPGGEECAGQAEMVHTLQPSPAEEAVLADGVSDVVMTGTGTPALWPVEGELRHLFWDPVSAPLVPPNYQYHYSRGVSIQTVPGAAVRAVWEGVAERVSDVNYPYGASVTIKHAGGLVSYYGALHNVQVSPGDNIRQGQVLGRVAPGDAGGPACLYLEIWEGEKVVDPLLYLSEK